MKYLLTLTAAFVSLTGATCIAQETQVLHLAEDYIQIDEQYLGSGEVALSESDAKLVFSPPDSGPNKGYARLLNANAIVAGEHYRLSFDMRAIALRSGVDTGQAGLQVTIGSQTEGDELDRGKMERQTVAVVGEELDTFIIDFQPSRDYAPGELAVHMSPTFFREVIEVKELTVVGYGNTAPPLLNGGEAYPGHSPDAAWRAEADQRIEEHRMAPVSITVIDEWGNPIEGAEVQIRMTRHEYLFGTCIKAMRFVDEIDFSELNPDHDYEKFDRDTAIYLAKLKELFNYVVFENDLKWPRWAGRIPTFSQQNTMDALKWLAENDFTVKGHTMMWGSWRMTPAYVEEAKDDPERLNAAIDAHLRDQSSAMRDWVQYADVLNEAMSHNDLIEAVGWDEVANWFKTAKAGMPDVQLVINEFNILGNGGSTQRQDDHEAFIQRLLDQGAPVDVIGFQSHFWSNRLTAPERLYQIIDRFSAFGLPLTVSEFDMNILDEQLQADYTRDFLKIWFSHPATESYIMWGFWARHHWFGEPGAMFREDWTPKPNLHAYKDLLFNEWWTEEDLVTNSEGQVSCRAFKGDYEVLVTAPGRFDAPRRPTISTEGLEMTIVLYPMN